jgi:quercetin dioxygenase-like cupin family protein
VVSIVRGGEYEPMVGDPDDHRPNTRWLALGDPGDADAPRANLAVILERVAAGDRIPLHRHDVDEAIIVIEGHGTYHLDGVEQQVGPGDVVFVPAGATHGTLNDGERELHLHAFFPSSRVRMEMLDRNPAPGTEAHPPMISVYDFTTAEVTVIGPTDSNGAS